MRLGHITPEHSGGMTKSNFTQTISENLDNTKFLQQLVLAVCNQFPGGNSELVPPDPIPNSEVKRLSADDSVGSPHVKVGHCQVFN